MLRRSVPRHDWRKPEGSGNTLRGPGVISHVTVVSLGLFIVILEWAQGINKTHMFVLGLRGFRAKSP